MYKRFNRLLDDGWFVVEHGLEMRANNSRHQHVMLSVHALYLETVQEGEDVIRSWMRPRSRCKMLMDLDLVVPTSKLGHGELECDVSTTSQRDCQ